MTHAKRFFGIAMVLAGIAARANAAELQSATERAWREYLRAAGIRLQARVEGRTPFLWMDEAGSDPFCPAVDRRSRVAQ